MTRELAASSKPPDISVVVPCFNHGAYLPRLLESVLLPRNDEIKFQVVLVDDGSTDDSRSVATGLAQRFPEVELVLKENGGLASARNAGIARCRGRFVHFLDADDHVLPGAYRAWLDAFERTPEADLIYGGFIVIDRISGRTWEHTYPDHESVLMTLITHSPFPPHALLLRASAVARIGCFDGSVPACEDWDYWARAYSLGLTFGRIDRSMVVYDRQPRSMSRSFRKMLRTAKIVRARTKLLETNGSTDRLTWKDRRALVNFFFGLSSYDYIVTELRRGQLVPISFLADLVRADPLVLDGLLRFARSHKRLVARAVLGRISTLLRLRQAHASGG